MAEQFDEATITRFMEAFGQGAAADFAKYWPPLAAAGGQPPHWTPGMVKSGIRAVLASLSRDYAIVPKAEYEQLQAAFGKAVRTFHGCPLDIDCRYIPCQREQCWREWLLAKEASPDVR